MYNKKHSSLVGGWDKTCGEFGKSFSDKSPKPFLSFLAIVRPITKTQIVYIHCNNVIRLFTRCSINKGRSRWYTIVKRSSFHGKTVLMVYCCDSIMTAYITSPIIQSCTCLLSVIPVLVAANPETHPLIVNSPDSTSPPRGFYHVIPLYRYSL